MSNVVITEHVIVVEPFGNISPLSTSWSDKSVIIKHAIVVEPFGNMAEASTFWSNPGPISTSWFDTSPFLTSWDKVVNPLRNG